MGVRLMGRWDGPARAANDTGCTGGREVVTPVSSMLRPVRCAHIPTKDLRHIFPWQGPMVTVL